MTQHIKLLTLFLFITLTAGATEEKFGCFPPQKRENIEFSCSDQASGEINCFQNNKLPIGTQIKYSCAQNYSRINIDRKDQLICDSSQNWSGLNNYLSFGCQEGSETKRVVFGIETSIQGWPWHVAIYARRNSVSDFQYICGGSLIHPEDDGEYFVLTAAHCVATSRDEPRNLADILVVFRPTSSRLGESSNIYNVSLIILHDSYQTKDYQSDIAMLHIANFQPNYWVKPVSLDHVTEVPSNGSVGKLVGFGRYDGNSPNISETLREAQIPIVDPINCYNWRSDKLLPLEICAGTEGNENVCNGDSGGGLVFIEPFDPEYVEGVPFYLQGIISHGRKGVDDLIPKCDTFSVFTNVYHYYDWIVGIAEKIHSTRKETKKPQIPGFKGEGFEVDIHDNDHVAKNQKPKTNKTTNTMLKELIESEFDQIKTDITFIKSDLTHLKSDLTYLKSKLNAKEGQPVKVKNKRKRKGKHFRAEEEHDSLDETEPANFHETDEEIDKSKENNSNYDEDNGEHNLSEETDVEKSREIIKKQKIKNTVEKIKENQYEDAVLSTSLPRSRLRSGK